MSLIQAEMDSGRFVEPLKDLLQFKKAADGGLTLRIQNESPCGDKEANWLPAPKGPFFMAMRLYWPKDEELKGKWTAPLLKRVQ